MGLLLLVVITQLLTPAAMFFSVQRAKMQQRAAMKSTGRNARVRVEFCVDEPDAGQRCEVGGELEWNNKLYDIEHVQYKAGKVWVRAVEDVREGKLHGLNKRLHGGSHGKGRTVTKGVVFLFLFHELKPMWRVDAWPRVSDELIAGLVTIPADVLLRRVTPPPRFV